MFHLKILNSKRFVFNSYWPIKQTKGRRNHFKGILRHDAGKRKHDTFNQKQDFKHHVSWRVIELALSGYHPENTFFVFFEKRTRVLGFTTQFAISGSCLPHLINAIVFFSFHS